MTKRLILHLGLHKTATTSLQDFLASNMPALLRGGVRYIPLQRMRTDVTPLFWGLDKHRRTKLGEFIRAIQQNTVLLSDENLIGVPGELTQGGIYPYARNRVISFCEDMADCEITFFLTLREPSLFLTSMYCEYLRHNEFITFDAFVSGLEVPGFSYREAFGWLSQLPSNARAKFIPFEDEHGGGVRKVVTEIVHSACGPDAGIDIDAFPAHRSRSSYSTEEIELAADIARRAHPVMSKVFLNALDARDRRFGETRFTPFPPEVVEMTRRQYRADLDVLCRS